MNTLILRTETVEQTITGERRGTTTEPAARERMRILFNKPENNRGQKIKILLATPVFSEGVTLKNVRQIHIIEPPWNMSRMQQVIGRGIRNRSHDDLPPKDRTVEIFRYAALAPDSAGVDSIDLVKYRVAEKKDRSIKKMERILKRAAFDCALNRERNILDFSFNNLRDCDYQKCNYFCVSGQIPKNTDISTWPLSINEYDLKVAKDQIKNLFKFSFFWSLSDLQEALNQIDPMLISVAVNDILEKGEVFQDHFNRNGSLIFRGDFYIFQPESVPDDSSIYEIEQAPLIPSKGSLQVFLKRLEKERPTSLPKPPQKTKSKGTPPSDPKKGRKMQELSPSSSKFNENIIKKYKVYGTYYNRSGVWDSKFRIVDLRDKEAKDDRRKVISGQACSSSQVKNLKSIAEFLGAKKEDFGALNRTGLCMFLEELFNKKGIILK